MMLIEVQAIYRAANLSILKHTLCTIAKRNNGDALASNRHAFSKVVHVSIADIGRNVPMHPRIKNTSTIDAQQNSQSGLFSRMINVGKCVDTAFGVVVYITQHTVDHAAGARRSGYLTRVEHIQGKRIVGLVATTIGNGGTRLHFAS